VCPGLFVRPADRPGHQDVRGDQRRQGGRVHTGQRAEGPAWREATPQGPGLAVRLTVGKGVEHGSHDRARRQGQTEQAEVDRCPAPYYSASIRNWRKWRLTYEGGDRFIEAYLKRFSKREDDQDFLDRKYVTYNPAFAKKAVNEVKNAVFQRMVDVARVGGDPTYQAAVAGLGRGVDLLGAGMNAFIGRRLLPELLIMGRVGCYVDMPVLASTSKAAVKGKQPYLYWYPAEDVCSWTTNDDDEFTELLLIDSVIEANGDEYYLPYDTVRRYRHVWLDEDGFVNVQIYGEDDLGAPNSQAQEPVALEPVRLEIKKIPFVMLEIGGPPESWWNLCTDGRKWRRLRNT
jgi:hypothetical protein